MRVTPKDRVIIVTDDERHDIGDAILKDRARIAQTSIVRIEDFVKRPATVFRIELQQGIRAFEPTVSILCCNWSRR